MATARALKAASAAPVTPSLAWGHVLGAGLFLTVILFIPWWGEPFSMPKAIVATATALAMTPLLWLRHQSLREIRWPVGLASTFLLLGVASVLFSGSPWALSLWGDWGRRAGVITVLSLVLIFAVSAVLTRSEVRVALGWLVWAGVPATAYGLLELIGADPFSWTDRDWLVSTFGNPNFAAAGLSMLALLSAGWALVGGVAPVWRLAMAPLAAIEALLALATGSSLAIFALSAGALAGALAWAARSLVGRRRVLVFGILATGGLVAGAFTVLGLLGTGPLAVAVSPDTLQFRRWYWSAASRMLMSHPLFGVGPDGYGRFYGEYRSPETSQLLADGANNSHSVPLQWGATLGLPAALVYVALVVLVAAVVLRRLWTQGGATSSLAIPLFAAWTAYQVQSMVSIDEKAVAVMGWFMMGALLAVTARTTRPPVQASSSRAVGVVSALLAIVGLVLWIPSVSASNDSRTVLQGTTEADVRRAVELVNSSVLPCTGANPVARWMTTVAPSEETVESVFGFVERDARCYPLVNAAADFAIQLKQPERAVQLATQAVAIDPWMYSPWLLLARAESLAGNQTQAEQALNRAVELGAGQEEAAKTREEIGLTPPSS